MDVSEREAMAKAIVDGNSYMTLATADATGVPWASPVWYAVASYREYLWVSRPGARHSENIAVRPEVGIVIFDSTVPINTGKAVYMAALAEQVTDDGETPQDVGPSGRVRLYRSRASEQFVLSPEDERLPLRLE